MSTLQSDEKPTISEVSKWEYTKQIQQGFHEGDQVGNKDGRHVLDKRERTNEVLRGRAAARRRDKEMERRSRSNKVPTNEASQASGPRVE